MKFAVIFKVISNIYRLKLMCQLHFHLIWSLFLCFLSVFFFVSQFHNWWLFQDFIFGSLFFYLHLVISSACSYITSSRKLKQNNIKLTKNKTKNSFNLRSHIFNYSLYIQSGRSNSPVITLSLFSNIPLKIDSSNRFSPELMTNTLLSLHNTKCKKYLTSHIS